MMSAERESGERDATTRKTDAPHGAQHESVRNLHLQEFVCVAPETSLADAITRLEQAGSDGIFVSADGHIAGVLTYREMFGRAAAGADLKGVLTVGECMSTDVQIVTAEETLGHVVRRMNESKQTHAAVTEGERFIGAISDLEIITYLAESYPKETMNLPPVPAQVMDTREGG